MDILKALAKKTKVVHKSRAVRFLECQTPRDAKWKSERQAGVGQGVSI